MSQNSHFANTTSCTCYDHDEVLEIKLWPTADDLLEERHPLSRSLLAGGYRGLTRPDLSGVQELFDEGCQPVLRRSD